MNFNQLLYLKELIHSGSFTKAAAKLGISQPALSTQIKMLEQESEITLIDRHARPIKLTSEGEEVYQIVLEILQRMESLSEISLRLQGKREGVLILGIIPTLAPYLVPLFMDELQEKYPRLELVIEELITEEIIRRIRTGHLDGGVISTPVEAGKLHFRILFYEQFFLYVSDRHPLYSREYVTMNDIDLNDLWYLKEGNCFQNQVNAVCRLAGRTKSRGNLVYKSNSIESLRRIVETRHGMAFLPELATMSVPSEREDMIKPIRGVEPVREISLVTGSVYARRHLLDAFVEVVLSQLPSHMKTRPSKWVVATELSVGQFS
ncbi:MAG TPA: hydrogen peroxide-inducible genes activator [Bacteroidetes bacterium]|nr:hydrogen peroxide-inducible genes activator [Bacteroidota bacterium]